MFNNFNQPPYPNPMYSGGQYKPHKPTKKDLENYIAGSLGASEVIKVDDFETLRTRHICKGTTNIQILEKRIFNVPTDYGMIGVETIFCPCCRKLLINKESLEIM